MKNSRTSTPDDYGAPMLLLVSVVAVAFSVAGIIFVGVTGTGWAVGLALAAAMIATAAVIVFLAQMLSGTDEAG